MGKILGLGTNVINTYIRQYGLNNTVKFIEKYLSEPKIDHKSNQSYYKIYINN